MSQTTKEIHEVRSKMWDASIENHKRYIDPITGMFDTKYVEHRPCPVCGSSEHLKMFDKEGGTYVKCKDCTMVFTNPTFKDESLQSYYESNHTVQSEIVDSDTSFYTNLYNKGLDSIEKATPGLNSVIDIGCSAGNFLDLVKARGLEASGVELNQAEYQTAKSKGHTVYNKLLEELSFEKKFDAVTLWDVFEHLKDGHFYLKLIKDLISDNGSIFLQIPSSDSLAAKVLRERCNMFDGLEHVNLYGVETITKLANMSGLKVESIETVISEIGVINNYLSYEDPYKGEVKNKDLIANLISENQIHESLQGYKLQIVLKKML